jgi:hypothetical protein
MINSIGNSDPTQTSSTAAAQTQTTSTSTQFSDELDDQLSNPNPLVLFDPTLRASWIAANGGPNDPAAAAAASAPATPAAQPAPAAPPTAQSVFGDNPWVQDPTGQGPDGTTWQYNPIYFATPSTAQQVASMVGGTVIQEDALTPNGPMQQSVPNEMVQLSNGSVVNPGLIADFYDHGYPQSMVDQMIQNEIQGV